MIKNVSWTDYWTVIFSLCAIYYIAIIILYYRKEALELFSGKRKLLPSQAAPPTSKRHPAEHDLRNDNENNTQEEKLFGLTNQLMQEISPVFGNEYVKGELMIALQAVLRKYSPLKGTAFQVSVNNYIQMESENQCSVNLSEGELSAMWNG